MYKWLAHTSSALGSSTQLGSQVSSIRVGATGPGGLAQQAQKLPLMLVDQRQQLRILLRQLL